MNKKFINFSVLLICLCTIILSKNSKFISGQTPSNKIISGYYESWSALWVNNGNDLSLSQIPSYITHIMLSFAKTDLIYKAGKNSFDDTGMYFSMDFSVVKEAISIGHRKNPNQKYILSVGGGGAPWNNPNFPAMVAFMTDLDCDGIDIDYEIMPVCKDVDTDNVTCDTDEALTRIIDTLRDLLPADKLLTAATTSTGAYGTAAYPNSQYGPPSNYTGGWVNPLKQSGSKLDALFIMSYESGTEYSFIDGFNAFKSIYKNKIFVGYEVPPETYGDYGLTVEDALKRANYMIDNGGEGVFVWSLQKHNDTISANTYLGPVCNLYGYQNCNEAIPLN